MTCYVRLMVCLPSCHNLTKVLSQYRYKGKTIGDISSRPSASPVCSLAFTGFNVAAQLHVLQLYYFQALEGNTVFAFHFEQSILFLIIVTFYI